MKYKLRFISSNVSGYDEIGRWYSFADDSDYVYASQRDQNIYYSYDLKLMILNKNIIGYFYGLDYYCLENKSYANQYEKVYELFELGVMTSNKSKEYCVQFVRYLISIASKKGCKKLIIKKHTSDFEIFIELCLKEFEMIENDGYLIFNIANQKVLRNEKNLIYIENDFISFKDLLFFKDNGFKLYKRKCVLKVNNHTITVDRKSGKVSFLNHQVLFSKEKLYSGIAMIIDILQSYIAEVFTFNVKIVDSQNHFYFLDAAYKDVAIVLATDISSLTRDNKELVRAITDSLIYNKVKVYSVSYDQIVGTAYSYPFIDKKTLTKMLNK